MDLFRKEYTGLTEAQKDQGKRIKEKAEELLVLFLESAPCSKEAERLCVIAAQELEGAVMWAIKGAFTQLPSIPPSNT